MSYEVFFLTKLGKDGIEQILKEWGFGFKEENGHFESGQLRVLVSSANSMSRLWLMARQLIQYADFSGDTPSMIYKGYYKRMKEEFGEIQHVSPLEGKLIDEPSELR